MERSQVGGKVTPFHSIASGEGDPSNAPASDVCLGPHAERAAREERLARAFFGVSTPLASFDADDRLDFCNGAYWHMIGLPASADAPCGERFERLLEVWLRRLTFASDAERVKFRIARLEQRSLASSEYEATTREGRRLRIIDERNECGGITSVVCDVTKEELVSEKLRRALVAAEAGGRAKSAFLRALIHELRTPLSALLGFAELMQRERREPLGERQRKRAQHIFEAGESLRLLIDDVAALALIDDGDVSVRVERIDALALLPRVRSLLSQTASRAEVHLSVAAAPVGGLPALVADPMQLIEVLLEFGANAIRYSRPQGSVTFAAAVCAEHVRLSVADTGPGVPAEKQHELFRPFPRAGRDGSGAPGTGLGLAISRRRAERMQAEVGFCNLPEGGAAFWIDLPLESRMTPS